MAAYQMASLQYEFAYDDTIKMNSLHICVCLTHIQTMRNDTPRTYTPSTMTYLHNRYII